MQLVASGDGLLQCTKLTGREDVQAGRRVVLIGLDIHLGGLM